MKFFEKHWSVGKHSLLNPQRDCVLVDWDAVRSEAMSEDERVLDDTRFGHQDFTKRYFRALKAEFDKAGKEWPRSIRYKSRLRLYTILKRIGTLPGLEMCKTSEQVYAMYPDIEKLMNSVEIAQEI